jgi:hypothetical protein
LSLPPTVRRLAVPALLVLSPKSRVVAASAIYVVVARTSTDDLVVTGTEYISYGVVVADRGYSTVLAQIEDIVARPRCRCSPASQVVSPQM